jgi:hypothetical protein
MSILKLFEKINVIFIIDFFEVIWVKTCRKSSRTSSIFDYAWSNAWFSRIWSFDSGSKSN